MLKRIALTTLAAAALSRRRRVATAPFQPADAQAWGDRDRDGVPNRYDQYSNNRRQSGLRATGTATAFPIVTTIPNNNRPNQAWGDRDRDGVPNAFDPDDNHRPGPNQALGDRDRDGVPNAFDPNNNRRFQ